MAGDVLVLATEAGGDGLSRAALEAIGVGVRLAAELGGTLSVAAPTGAAVVAAQYGADRVYTFDTGADMLAVSAEAARNLGARVVVVNRGAVGLDVVPRLAARLGGGCVLGVTDVSVVGDDIEAVAAIYGGAARAAYRFSGSGPRIVSLAPGAGEPPVRETGRGAEVTHLEPAGDTRVRVVEPAKAAEGPRLEDAPVVVSGGRGLRDGENYGLIRELAAALGGMPGASRAIVDDSWAKPVEQVGLTGKIVTPDLYFAIGISGASQHMAGCSNARTIVAINTDAAAPIFRYAHFGIVGDCLELLPALIRLAKERAAAD
ncbi:MAG: electron transfer flavoprotein subunit alpha/FixB family protein [Dehalococcoidia bacterium]